MRNKGFTHFLKPTPAPISIRLNGWRAPRLFDHGVHGSLTAHLTGLDLKSLGKTEVLTGSRV